MIKVEHNCPCNACAWTGGSSFLLLIFQLRCLEPNKHFMLVVPSYFLALLRREDACDRFKNFCVINLKNLVLQRLISKRLYSINLVRPGSFSGKRRERQGGKGQGAGQAIEIIRWTCHVATKLIYTLWKIWWSLVCRKDGPLSWRKLSMQHEVTVSLMYPSGRPLSKPQLKLVLPLNMPSFMQILAKIQLLSTIFP